MEQTTTINYIMKKLLFLPVVLLAAIILFNCSRAPKSSSNYMILDEVEYVNNFPQTFFLGNEIMPNIDIIGIKSFVIYDSIMIVSTNDKDGLWSVISLPNYKHLGSFLTKGNGPFEFVQLPDVSIGTKLLRENGQLLAYIYDFQKGRIFSLNVEKSIQTKELNMSILIDSIPPFLFNLVIIDSTNFFCKEVNYDQTLQLRFIVENKKRTTPNVLHKLNQASIRIGEDINLLSTSTKMNSENSLIVEMPIGLNYMNLYSLDGSFGKTICIGKKLDNIDKIQYKKMGDRIYTYADLRVFPKFWGVVHINEDEKTYQTGRKKLPSILLFDWQGTPLAELKLKHFITSFDIDLNNRDIYTFDAHSDELYKYDISDILAKLK